MGLRALGRRRCRTAAYPVVRADVDRSLREEALEAIVTIGNGIAPLLVDGLRNADEAISSGCAEALRQQSGTGSIAAVTGQVSGADPSRWAVWLLGMLPREAVAAHIAGLQESNPEVHYAVSLLWAFAESWIAKRWEFYPGPTVS